MIERRRGSPERPPNRFEPLVLEVDAGSQESPTRTRVFRDNTRTILSENRSPDVPFRFGLNPYRGCEHGCSYCYARPGHEFLGLSAGLDFESMLFAKPDAPELLARKLGSRSWTPEVIALSGVTDAYQPIEQRLKITRRCLEVLERFRNPVAIVTKSSLIRRDADLLSALAELGAASVTISVTSLDPILASRMEPRAASPSSRLKTIETLARAGIPVGVNVMPVIPGLTDHELPSILNASAQAGAGWAGYGIVRLPHGVKHIFENWLTQHYPDRREKVLNRIRSLRGGQLSDSRFGQRKVGNGEFASQTRQIFEVSVRRNRMQRAGPELDATHFAPPSSPQLSLF